ncbi:MAG: ribosomal L7Ae/L30e/S12e/Gadd45 family protein [Clostridia bacterium]|nr:ribosomal L7Ae/L30e/S12e/Gadd45 family protein [Clostridia bacterium]
MSREVNKEKGLLSVIGLCHRAGKAVIGVEMICETLKKRGVRECDDDVIVIEARDTSDNTHKRVSDKCAYYKVRHMKIESDTLTLGRAVGKSAVGAIMIKDQSFCRAIDKQLASKQNSQ